MAEIPVVIEVPADEADELGTLPINEEEVARGHGLDGSTVATVVLVLSSGTLPLLRVWLRARVDQRKAATVVLKGRRLTGYTANEVVRIISALEAEVTNDK